MKKFIKKFQMKIFILGGALLLNQFSFSNTSQKSAAGFEQVVTYFTSVKNMSFYLFYLIGVIYILWQIVEAILSDQYQQMFKKVFIAALAIGIGFGINKVVTAVGGNTVNKEKVSVIKKKKEVELYDGEYRKKHNSFWYMLINKKEVELYDGE